MAEQNIPTVYNPGEVEDKWYRHWENNKYFAASVEKDKTPFCIIMPPPNVTGQLHMGHALDNTLQDILTRWRRMQGYNALWVPGTDHAGIATQAKVEEQLAKEGLSKYDLGREKFLERVWAWKEQYGNRITTQLRRLGASCDWDRERFTMDAGCSRAVLEVFVRLFEQGLIYRDYYITNWCPHCQTTISDIEVEHQDKPGQLYYIKYPAKDNPDEYIVIATTRPETMLGDVAVAVNPEDERYRHLVGKTLLLPIVGRELPVIADDYCDPAFGTGAVKMTPAHDPNDFEIGRRHGLPEVVVIDKYGKMNEQAGQYQGLDRWECRKQIVRDLEKMGYLVKTEDISHAVGHCYRCNTAIEPMLSKQWFVKMRPLAEPAIQAVKEGRITFIPERFTKIYLNWMENIRDWCISRQLWWGHRIPVYYCQDCGEITASLTPVNRCVKCGGQTEQDPDVLDTWFSSALWPFSTLGWPDKTPELEHFYPTSVLVTGRDIIFFWVARMIFSGLRFMDQEPFKEVFIHGLVLDSLGRKMSKSLGNGVDPLDVIESHGADSLRFMLITGNTPGNDLRFHFERLDGARNFANKLWNASRFVMMNLGDYDPAAQGEPYTLADRWILSRLQGAVSQVTDYLERYELGEAARVLYDFIWSEFCDWYIELAKPRLFGKTTPGDRITAQQVLVQVLRQTLELLHPFMPFITEEIWQKLPHRGETVMLAPWPTPDDRLHDETAEKEMAVLIEVITAIRRIRGEMNVPPGKKAESLLVAGDSYYRSILERNTAYIQGLANTQVQVLVALQQKPEQSAGAVTRGVEIFVPLKGLIDLEKELARINKELKSVQGELARVQGKLNNQGFLAKAPAEVIEKERAKEQELTMKVRALQDRLAMLS
ncbi:valine--tRNA ligase [Desulforamulus hydrothermalis]|uniref:Valine--tRNA ligase n=1 Tax=Desulforamulus hydrothermalis Lam5 = DSM 18033 TaxID=1121428 RepID=K8DY90_9FIRM|nr:valine--tRNA ligase [Desulforamulus hydrothermalis]CCO07670.1 Valine--tRNA ligase [Desulforamulus hydrothermalis Lam5 = DSM 18033]SHH24996.1 valyl-tRNA synthetase [Desulforamulus hydrothermalis Lam5 = DSM 18033]